VKALGMAAEELYPKNQRGDNSSPPHNNSTASFEQLFDNVVALSEPPSAIETMSADTLSMSPSNNSQMVMNAYSGVVDSSMWGSHNVDFSAFAPPQTSNSWAWPHQARQNQQFDVRNGLTTPPKDDSPLALPSDASFGAELDGINPKEIANKKKRNSRKMSRGGDESEGATTHYRKVRKSSKVTSHSPEADAADGEDKREKFLERNRVAASKCRQKKKVWTNNLEERARELTSERHALAHHVVMLRNELLELKCKCLEHTNCDCVQIREYLKNTVAQLNPANSSLYQSSDRMAQRPLSSSASMSAPASASVVESPGFDKSRQSSTTETNLDYMKLEDDVGPTFTHSSHPANGGNGYKN
jgi:hypothetical protein